MEARMVAKSAFAVSLLVAIAATTFQTQTAAQHPYAAPPAQYSYAVPGNAAPPRVSSRSRAAERVMTRNFVVSSPDPAFSKKVAREAERFRKELSIEWLGYELEPWPQRCPIQVRIEPHAGGRTSFAFYRNGRSSAPTDWDMEIFGSPARILDSVLPHEVTHTIFATHFGRALPRWADEGACTTVEHTSEKKKNHRMLMKFLSSKPSRGLPFNRMFALKEYPRDILPLYAQGYSLARFLIDKKGKQEFVKYVGVGMKYEDRGMGLQAWNRATQEVYGYQDLSDLQVSWLKWVKKGSPKLPVAALAKNKSQADPTRPTSSKSLLNSEKSRPANVLSDSNGPSNFYVQHMTGSAKATGDLATATEMPTSSALAGIETINRPPINKKTSANGYRPGSISGAVPLQQVPSSAFVRPRPLDGRTREQMNDQMRGRPTIYR